MAGGKKTKAGPDTRVELAPFNPLGTTRQRGDMTIVRQMLRPNWNPPATKLMVQAFTQNVRYTIDGSAPTPTFGFRLTAGNDPTILDYGPDTIIQVIEEAATAILAYCWGQ